jgi:hypothetical protein
MTTRRSFLRTVTSTMTGGTRVAVSVPTGAPPPHPWLCHFSRYRRLKRLGRVDCLEYLRSRHPEGRDGGPGNRYLHELRCRGPYAGRAGDWDSMKCLIEFSASRPDPVLRLLGPTWPVCDESVYPQTHWAKLRFPAALPLEIYVEVAGDEEVLVVPAGAEPGGPAWTVPRPRWRHG